jgi:hypothetical protein
MSEAEIRTNSSPEPLNFVNLTAAAQVNISSYDLPSETLVPVIVPASQTQNRKVVDCATLACGFEASKNCLSAIAPSQRLELVNLIQALRSSNSSLSERVTQLEQALTECLKALQSHKKYSRVTESTLTQKTQELAATQKQIKCLSEETAASHQIVQRQQTLIESLTTQLQSSQERFAQLEWEHYLTKASYEEQSEQLVQTENTCRELRTRLNRQQCYTLQLKVALEKCTETPISRYQSEIDMDIPIDLKSEQGRSLQVQSFFSKAESIPPWSTQPQFLTNKLETEQIIPLQKAACVETFSQQRYSAASTVCDCSSFPAMTELAELRGVTTDSTNIYSANEDSESEEAQWENLLTMLEAVDEVTVTPELPTVSASTQLNEPLDDEAHLTNQLLDTGLDSVSPDDTTQTQVTSPQQKTSSLTPNSNWPSPVIYPSHSPKRSSLAAVELPTFTKLGART